MNLSRMSRGSNCLVWLALLVGSQAASAQGTASAPGKVSPAELKTKHYDLYVEALAPDEVGRMLEQAHEHMARFFGQAPRERLRLKLYAKPERVHEVLKAEGVALNGVGGYYSIQLKKAILYVQPSSYFTRQVLLHEALHQFHFLAATNNRTPDGGWYVEGLAEYFGMHNWDGTKLQVGVVPAATLEDYPATALAQLNKHKTDLQGLIEGKWMSRPAAWSLIHYLMHNEPQRFRALSEKINGGTAAAVAWQAVFGPDTNKHAAAWRQWVETHQQPWQIVWTSFQQRGEFLEGNAQTNGIAILKQPPTRLAVELDKVSGPCRAGLVFGYRSPNDFSLWQIQGAREVRLVERKHGGWKVGPTFPLPPGKGLPRLALVQADSKIELYANEVKLTTVSAGGQAGLNVDGCRVRFRVLDAATAGSAKVTEGK